MLGSTAAGVLAAAGAIVATGSIAVRRHRAGADRAARVRPSTARRAIERARVAVEYEHGVAADRLADAEATMGAVEGTVGIEGGEGYAEAKRHAAAAVELATRENEALAAIREVERRDEATAEPADPRHVATLREARAALDAGDPDRALRLARRVGPSDGGAPGSGRHAQLGPAPTPDVCAGSSWTC